MTQLLERALAEVSKLSEKEQDAVAALLLQELCIGEALGRGIHLIAAPAF